MTAAKAMLASVWAVVASVPAVSAAVFAWVLNPSAAVAAAHWQLGGAGLLLGNPSPESIDVESLIEEALTEAERGGVAGQGVTPFVLSYLHERSGGETLRVNRLLIAANAGLAARIAVAYAAP